MSYQLEYVTTGGGCSAIMVSGERYHALITRHADTEAPDDRTELVDVGYYAGAVPEGAEALHFEELESWADSKIMVPILVEGLDLFGPDAVPAFEQFTKIIGAAEEAVEERCK